MKLKELMGSGRKIGKMATPLLVIGLIINLIFPAIFSLGGPENSIKNLSVFMFLVGLVVWIWGAALILIKVPQKQLITSGPFALVKHPLYTAIALLVLPWGGIMLNSWLGIVVGMLVYKGMKIYAPEEEILMAKTFGKEWDEYQKRVLLPWV
jgi:protein-S-isoprenylcysteine O-methyltransferase Ste14